MTIYLAVVTRYLLRFGMGTAFALLLWAYNPGPTPAPIKCASPTEASIKAQVEAERYAKRIEQATRVAARLYKHYGVCSQYAELTGRYAIETGIPVKVLAALVYVESSCNPNAVSECHAIGLMQINPRVWHYSHAELTDPERNMAAGTRILAGYIHKHGLVSGLHHYNGLGNPTNEYANKVLLVAGYAPVV
ncbi:Endo-type membrane-bound lytic murein transglycosylase A [uncultured archaeon]|nr:Endo-type membrane-bound lytic murein transglycosylase A [uncultured archaeon]